MEKVTGNETEEAYFCGHLETMDPLDDMKDFNDEKFFRLMDPVDQEDREIYGEQYRHFEENYEDEAWPQDSDVEKDVGTTSLMPPSVAKTSTGTSPAEPEDDPKFGIFEVVSSSHNVAGEGNQSNSRYKAQCAAIGGDIGGEDSDFLGDEVLWTSNDSCLQGRATENHYKPDDHRRTGEKKPVPPQLLRTRQDDGCATIDTGCQRMAIGEETLHRLARQLPSNLGIGLVPQEHRFRSVNGTSSTTHLATIPTSLGNKGSLLRPAIFQEGDSKKAPFLISLPFLLHCRSVLYLDPERGLRLHLRRFGFGVDCHIGPTGALRVPLNQFTKEQQTRLQQLQEQLQTESSEFEILKTVHATNDGSSQELDVETGPREPSPICHEAQPDRGEPVRPRVGSPGSKDPVCGDATDGVGGLTDGTEDLCRNHGRRDGDGSERHGGLGTNPTSREKQVQHMANGDLFNTNQTKCGELRSLGLSQPPTASEEKSPGSYRPSTRSPNTPTELVEKPPEPKAFPKENSKKGKNLKGAEIIDEEDPETCEHHKTTKRGTNAFVNVEKCLKCGKILKSERKADLTEIKIKIEPGDQEEKPMMDKDKADFAEFLEYQKWKAERNRSQTGGNKK